MTFEDLQYLIKHSTDSKEIWLDAEEAQVFGIVDEIGVPAIQHKFIWDINVAKDRNIRSFAKYIEELEKEKVMPKTKKKKSTKKTVKKKTKKTKSKKKA